MTTNTKKAPPFLGVGTALITPFRDGEVDLATFRALCERQIAGGVSALIVAGTTGEAATLSDEERYALFHFVKDRLQGRCRLILGTGTNDTKVALRHTRAARELGCDGVLCVTPYYNKGTSEGLLRHYLTLAESVDVPIILYNVPARTGVHLSEEQLDVLADHEHIVGIKEAADSADRLVTLAAMSDRLALYAGNDTQIFSVAALGGRGVISVASNLLPAFVGEIYRAARAGRWDDARARQLHLLPLVRALFAETNPTPIKYLLSRTGICRADVRLPLTPPSDATRLRLDALLHTLPHAFPNEPILAAVREM